MGRTLTRDEQLLTADGLRIGIRSQRTYKEEFLDELVAKVGTSKKSTQIGCGAHHDFLFRGVQVVVHSVEVAIAALFRPQRGDIATLPKPLLNSFGGR